MRNLSFTLFMFFWTIFAYGQSYDEFVASNNIDEKCRLAEKIALHYVSTNIDSLKLIGEQLLSFSNSKKSKKGIYTSYGIIGNAMVRSAQEKKGLELLRKAKNYFLSVENYDKVTEIYNEIGNGYQFLGDYKEAVKWYEYSLKYGELSTDEYTSDMAKINIAQALSHLKEFDEAVRYAKEYRDWVLKLGSLKSLTNAYAVLGSIALERGQYRDAINYFQQCYEFALKAGDNSGQGHAYTNLGIAKFLEGKMEESVDYFKKAIEFREKVNNIALICDAYLNYGGIMFELSRYDEAIQYYTIGLKIAQKNEKYANEIELLEALKEVYETVDLEEVEKIALEIERVQKKEFARTKEQSKFDVVLAKELLESEEIYKSGFTNENDKWSFYIGLGIIFILFTFLAIRKKVE